jgi:hypothetical protein
MYVCCCVSSFDVNSSLYRETSECSKKKIIGQVKSACGWEMHSDKNVLMYWKNDAYF